MCSFLLTLQEFELYIFKEFMLCSCITIRWKRFRGLMPRNFSAQTLHKASEAR